MKLKRFLFLPLFIFLTLVLQSCGKTEERIYLYEAAQSKNYFTKSQEVSVEVYYETGAAPFDNNISDGSPLWSILGDNLTAIFQFRSNPPDLFIPTNLNEMVKMQDHKKDGWSVQNILDLHYTNKGPNPSKTHARFYIYFVNGYLDTGDELVTNVIGVSIKNTPVIAVFKDVVRSSATNPNGIIAQYVEQSTLVHELGHSLGFVNNGVPMAEPHQDAEHGAHTTDENSVMYWQNEGANDLRDFIIYYTTSGSKLMWGDKILADAQGFSQ